MLQKAAAGVEQLARVLPFYYYAERGCEDLLPGDPGGLTGSRCSSYEDRQAWRILANALCFLGAGTFQKGIWDYQVREEIVTKGTGRETQKRGELGRRRGNLCEENETKFQTGKNFYYTGIESSREDRG